MRSKTVHSTDETTSRNQSCPPRESSRRTAINQRISLRSDSSTSRKSSLSSGNVLQRGSIESAESLESNAMNLIFSGHLQVLADSLGESHNRPISSLSFDSFEDPKFNLGIHEILDYKNQQNAAAKIANVRRVSCSNVRSSRTTLEPVIESDQESSQRSFRRSVSMPMISEHSFRYLDDTMFSSDRRLSGLSKESDKEESLLVEDDKGNDVDENNLRKLVKHDTESRPKDTATASTDNDSSETLNLQTENSHLDKHTKRKHCARISIPFSMILAVMFSILICTSGIFIHATWYNVASTSKEESFEVSESNIVNLLIDLNQELSEKIGLEAQSMFSRPEQSFKHFVNALRDGLYDPVKDRYQLVHDMIRADTSTSYASVAFENGYYLANGHFSLSILNSTEDNQEVYTAVQYKMEWLSSYNQPVFYCPNSSYQVRVDDQNWTLYQDERFVLGKNIHWSQALVESDGSVPIEKVANEKIECRDQFEMLLEAIEDRKNYTGWFQDVEKGSDSLIDAKKNKGVGQPAFALAELWTVETPQGHFDNQTFATYNFSNPIWPDNNIFGNHTYVSFQNSSGMPMRGIKADGLSKTMYQQDYDARKRQWYQRAKELYNHNSAAPRGYAAYHKPVIAWFPAYVWQTKYPDLAIGLTAPLYGPNDEFAGVVTTDISIKAISRFLADQSYGLTGVGFAVRSEDYFHSHGGIGLDQYINMTYNNHVGALMGVSLGSDYGKACGNDYTNNNVEPEKYGPHYELEETEWYNYETKEQKDYKDLKEMVLPIKIFNRGGWKCRLKGNKSEIIDPTNRALPAENHENNLIALSTQYINKKMGGFDGLVANSTRGHIIANLRDQKGVERNVHIQWRHVSGLEFPGFSPLIIVVVPEEDYLAEVWEANELSQIKFEEAMSHTTIVIILFMALTTFISIWVALIVTMPLKRLKSEFIRISKLDIEDNEKSDETSFIREIASIQHSFRGMRMGLKSFCKFVPFAVVKRIVGGDVSATLLGVQKRTVTVMFADIANFTTFVEKFPLESVMLVLEEYLTAMVSAIEGQGGTIGDFIGDCIMAFWNSPLDQPDHAQLAINAAFAMEQKLKTWNEIWGKQGLPPLRIRIGIHTGEVLSGNIGSPVKMKFGVVGDTVNLASRVENLNKFYGSSRLLTDATYKCIADKVICRPVDKVAVKGRKGETLLYEPMAMQDVKDAKELKKIAEATSEMLSLFWDQEFEKTYELTEEHLCLYPHDEIVVSLKEKAREFIYNPPGSKWDGVNRMDEK